MSDRQSRLGEVGDPHAPVGSRLWAMFARDELRRAIHDAEFSAESARNYFEAIRASDGWKQLEAPGGRRFRSFDEFCCTKKPHGLGYSTEAIDALIRERREREVSRLAQEPPTLAKHGGDRKSEDADQASNSNLKGGTTAEYLTARIARDSPEVLEKMKAGEFKSVRQAAIAAGIVKVKTPMQELQRWWKKASTDEKSEFITWIGS